MAPLGAGTALTLPRHRVLDRLRHQLHWSVFLVMLVLLALYASGIVNRTLYPIITFGSVLSAVVGLHIAAPTYRWPWVTFSVAAVLWTVTGVVESMVGASGDLSAARSLWPDVFAVPGYVLIGVGLVGLQRVSGVRERTALIDGLMLGTAVGVVVYEWLVLPAFRLDNTWTPALLTVVSYPTMSIGLVVIAGRLAFAPRDRTTAFRLLLAGVFSLHLGDIFYALGEIGQYDAPQSIREAPYLLAPTFFSAAVLHPTVGTVGTARVVSHVRLGRARTLAVTSALGVAPVLLAIQASSWSDVFTVLVCVFLVVLAGTRIVAAMREQTDATDQMYHRATHDDLTGLPGRALLLQHLGDLHLDPHVHDLSLMFVDLDRFKQINDTMGHAAGDQLLTVAASRVVASVRSTDRVYRLAGDEFVVLAPNVQRPGVDALASRIRESLRRPYLLSSGQVFSSASIGVASAPTSDHQALLALLGQADEAMYVSKQNGRDTTTQFDVSMRRRTERRLDIERRLHAALDTGALRVHYQPIVTGTEAHISGFEALVRWTTEDGPIRPDEFIPVAEESGLIVPIGRFVLDSACAQLAAWRRSWPNGECLTMSVNLSLRQIRSGDIVDLVAESLQRHRLPGEALWLEITESVMAEDAVSTAAVFAALRRLGVRLSVDDFGTGYSSLSYLKQFPLSRVKIDRAFVTGICDDDSDHSLVAAIVAMAQALGLEPVAEGVERAEQAEQLRELGCMTMQGFYFGRPDGAHVIARRHATVTPAHLTAFAARRSA